MCFQSNWTKIGSYLVPTSGINKDRLGLFAWEAPRDRRNLIFIRAACQRIWLDTDNLANLQQGHDGLTKPFHEC